jgi:methylamine dehydrogenase heavy chain
VRRSRLAAGVLVAGALGALWLGRAAVGSAPQPLAPEALPRSGDHHVWITDRIWQHSALFDGDTGQVLGMIDAPSVTVTPKLPMHAPGRGEIYSVDIAYSRGRRGDRVDFVTIYDDRTLEVRGEIVLPTRTSDANTSIAYAALLDGEHFVATFNQFPIAAVSIADLERRAFTAQVAIAGCAGIFPTGERAFASLCDDGTAALVQLDDAGQGRVATHSARFFDPVADPVTMAAVRAGTRWVFVSFEGHVHAVDFSADPPAVAPSWSLLSDADRAERWRVGGLQHLALHAATGRLFAIVHQGERGSHKAPGPEVWVFDLEKRERVARYALPNFMAAYAAPRLGVERGGRLHRLLQSWTPSDGAHSLVVTQDEAPLLFARNAEVGVVAVLDARSGEHLRNLEDVGIAGPTMGLN